MSKLADLVANMRPVTPADLPVLRELAARHAAHTVYPRFFLSPSYLAAYPDAFGWAEIEGCLVLIKRRQIMGNPAIYLIIPPQHKGGAPMIERDVIEQFRAQGASTMLAAEDILRYGYTAEDTGPAGLWGNEYVYAAAEYGDLSAHKNTRATMNRLARAGEFEIREDAPLADIEGLARTWQKQTGRHASEIKVARQWHAHRGAHSHISAIYEYDRLIAYSLSEELSPGRVALVARLHDYTSTLRNPPMAVHALDSAYWHQHSPGALMNFGAAGSTALAGHKAKLSPVAVLSVHKLATTTKLTMDAYKEAKPCTTQHLF